MAIFPRHQGRVPADGVGRGFTSDDRYEIVHLISNDPIPGYLPTPVETEQF